jgi:hypothetical protein
MLTIQIERDPRTTSKCSYTTAISLSLTCLHIRLCCTSSRPTSLSEHGNPYKDSKTPCPNPQADTLNCFAGINHLCKPSPFPWQLIRCVRVCHGHVNFGSPSTPLKYL